MAALEGIMEMKSGGRTLADFKGHAVLLNLWATWCVPCLKELPTLDALERTWGEKGLVVIPLSMDNLSYTQLRSFLDKQNAALPHLAVDNGDIGAGLTWNALPTTFLINRKGEVIAHFAGATDWTDAKHETWLKKALEGEGR
jgi:thiol-disulfide isomerase/thioredoxin